MTYQSKKLEAYPTHFFDILRHVSQGGLKVSLPFAERKRAERLRFTFYGFQAALERAGKRDEYTQAKSIIVKLKDHPEGCQLEFAPRDQDDQFVELREGLAMLERGERAAREEREIKEAPEAPEQESTVVSLYGEGQARKKG